MTSITGIFETPGDADKAVNRLLSDGFTKDHISVLIAEAGGIRREMAPAHYGDASSVAEGGLTGAAIGGALGALLATLTTVGSLALPGGTVLMAGPVVAALSGAGAGGLVGGLSGVLIGAGFAMDDARRYEEDINAGKSIVVVNAIDEIKQARARVALRSAGAITRVA